MLNETEEARYLSGSYCPKWLDSQNPAFHFSMIAFAAAFLAPYTFKYYVIALRGLLVTAFVLLIIWGSVFWCTYDVIIWGIVFLFQNLGQLIYALYKRRHVRFPAELEDVYSSLFEPFGITRHQFKVLINHNCKWVNIFPGDRYAVENHTDVEARVSLLVSGCLKVTYQGVYLHDVKEKQFIDSVEWESTKMRRGELFQVTAEAIDRCFYLCWNREKLQYFLEACPEIKVAFDYIRGRDIMEKICQTALNASRRSDKEGEMGEEKNVDIIGIRRGMAAEDPILIYE